MMMTSGEAVKYSGSIDCCIKIVRAEGFMTLMKGAGNVLAILLDLLPVGLQDVKAK